MTEKKLTEVRVVLSTTTIADLLIKIIFLAKKRKPSRERGDTKKKRRLRQIIAYSDTISATTIQGTEDAICLEREQRNCQCI